MARVLATAGAMPSNTPLLSLVGGSRSQHAAQGARTLFTLTPVIETFFSGPV